MIRHTEREVTHTAAYRREQYLATFRACTVRCGLGFTRSSGHNRALGVNVAFHPDIGILSRRYSHRSAAQGAYSQA